jgi:hypothetical protein
MNQCSKKKKFKYDILADVQKFEFVMFRFTHLIMKMFI